MRMHTTTVLLFATALPLAPAAMAQEVTFEMIPGALSANDLSPDGRWICGERDIDGNGTPLLTIDGQDNGAGSGSGHAGSVPEGDN